MEVQQIVRELDEEIARLKAVRALLAGKANETRNATRRGRPAKAAGKKRGRLSDAGRRRISEALKRRWAERRKALAKATKPAVKAAKPSKGA